MGAHVSRNINEQASKYRNNEQVSGEWRTMHKCLNQGRDKQMTDGRIMDDQANRQHKWIKG